MSGTGFKPVKKGRPRIFKERGEQPSKISMSSSELSFEIPTLPKLSLPPWRVMFLAFVVTATAYLFLGPGVKPLKLSFLSGAGQESVAQPSFETLASGGSGVPASPKFDKQKNVASFTDKISGVDIIVSQQPLPDKFKQNAQKEVENLAKGFNASKVINFQNKKAFYGTSKDDSLVVLFEKNGLLIFIRAQKDIEKEAVAHYIVNLK